MTHQLYYDVIMNGPADVVDVFFVADQNINIVRYNKHRKGWRCLFSSLQWLQNFIPSIYKYDTHQRTGFAEKYCKAKINSRSDEGKESVLLLLYFHETPDIFWSSERYWYFTNVLTNFNRSGTSSNILKILRFYFFIFYSVRHHRVII